MISHLGANVGDCGNVWGGLAGWGIHTFTEGST